MHDLDDRSGRLPRTICFYADGVKLLLRRSRWMGLGTCPVRYEGDEGWVETGDTGRIAVSPGFDPHLLADVVDVLEGRQC